MRDDPAPIQLTAAPLHYCGVHAVLHRQHGTHGLAEQCLQPLEQGAPQALQDDTVWREQYFRIDH